MSAKERFITHTHSTVNLAKASLSVFRLILRFGLTQALGLGVGTLAVSAAPVALSIIAALLIIQGANPDNFANGNILSLLILFLMVLFVQELASQLLTWKGQLLQEQVDTHLQQRVLTAILAPSGITHVEHPEMLNIYTSVRNLSPFGFTPGEAARQLPLFAAVRLQSILSLVVIAVYMPLLTVVSTAVYVVAQLLAISIIFKMVTALYSSIQKPEMGYLADLILKPQAAKEVRIFRLKSWIIERYTRLSLERIRQVNSAQSGLLRGLLESSLFLALGLLASLLWITLEVRADNISIEVAAICIMATLRIFATSNYMHDIPVAYGATSISAIQNLESEIGASYDAQKVQTLPDAPPFSEAIRFHKVTFQYPASTKPILHDLDLSIAKGERIAIVGLNGSGKTTLIKLLCNLYAPTKGKITVDDVDLTQIDPKSWRRQIGIQFQDYLQWDLPVKDNIQLRPTEENHPADMQAVERAIDGAGIRTLIDGLPRGSMTSLGSVDKFSVGLSGGEWQKLALARALVPIFEGGRILILDEPTSKFDLQSEQKFFEDIIDNPALREHNQVTIIFASHRFATVRRADRILVIDDGRIVEQGNHDELMAEGEIYSNLFRTQAASYNMEH